MKPGPFLLKKKKSYVRSPESAGPKKGPGDLSVVRRTGVNYFFARTTINISTPKCWHSSKLSFLSHSMSQISNLK